MMTCNRRRFLAALASLLPPPRSVLGQLLTGARARTQYLSFDRAAAYLNSGAVPLPSSLAGLTPEDLRNAWPAWMETHDREIRARVLRGEEDTLVNFVLFGTSFTTEPRVAPDVSYDTSQPRIESRIEAFVAAMEKNPANERLIALAGLLGRLGHTADSFEGKERLTSYISESVRRYYAEKQTYARAAELSAQNTDSPEGAAAQLYRNRGLSVDTDFRPNYAVERGLSEVQRRRLLRTIRRVAIIGPGLDFTDKDAGFDHYPLQTLQPFAVIDSLLRLGLSSTESLQVTLFDISDATLSHVASAIRAAERGQSYPVQLLLDQRPAWNAAVLEYWSRSFGTLGDSIAPVPLPPNIQNAQQRAVRIRPEIVRMLNPVSLNAVVQHLNLPDGERFDLVVATNVFIYYDKFDQGLSLLNIEAMLAPGGVLLSNDFFQDYSGVRLRPIGSVAAEYSPGQSEELRLFSIPAFQPQLPPL